MRWTLWVERALCFLPSRQNVLPFHGLLISLSFGCRFLFDVHCLFSLHLLSFLSLSFDALVIFLFLVFEMFSVFFLIYLIFHFFFIVFKYDFPLKLFFVLCCAVLA